jgi:hypothetical protein
MTIVAGILLVHSAVLSVHAVGVWTGSQHGFRFSGMDAHSAFTHGWVAPPPVRWGLGLRESAELRRRRGLRSVRLPLEPLHIGPGLEWEFQHGWDLECRRAELDNQRLHH